MIDVGPVLAAGRRAFLARMRGTCLIRRPIGETTNEDGKVVPVYAEPAVHEGPCYTRYPGIAFEANPEAGGSVFTISRVVVRIPFGPVVRPGDIVEITKDPDNPSMVGTVLRVASNDDQSQATAQRLLCEDYQSGVA